ncbi:3-hydroxybutyrate dehydrogenase [Parasalinivibrio latis]|uniref:3-hydroxybutyrate dehydrogenase n=1 Tax=Parasalinivibrio latis TaxID=2952610 RepID=UPI0030E03B07
MSVGKHVFVTGGASGIGFAIGRHFAIKGYTVTLSDVNADNLSEAAKALEQEGITVDCHVMDVTDQAQVDALPEQMDMPVDILVNNAGIQHVSPLEEFPSDRWKLLIDIMLTAPAMLTKTLLPSMRERGYGRIINVGSIHSLVASPYKSAYVAAKHGLLGFAKTVALETGDTDITINTLCPSYVLTPLVENQIADQARANGISEEEVINDIMLVPMPKKAFIHFEELAETALFLVSPQAKNITAQAIALDGGWTAR